MARVEVLRVPLELLAGCGTLPNSYEVESKFKAQHPGCVVERVHYNIEGYGELIGEGPGEMVRDGAVFEISYRMPGDSTNRIAFRRFSRGPEGWVEQTP